MHVHNSLQLGGVNGNDNSSICWLQPTCGQYKLKVDGSVSAFNKEAVGDVFRDSNGQLLFSYAADIGSCTQLL